MEFRVLGPVEVHDAGRSLRVGGAKQRALLAVLLLDAGRVVSADRLIEDLWGDDPPPTAPKMLQVLVSRLRGALEDGGSVRVLVTQTPGYAIRIESEQLDLSRFESRVAAGRSALPDDPATAASQLREALSLWHGEPLEDVALEPFAAPAIARLEEMRLSAIEDRVDADLALGQHGELIGELRDLVADNPLRERLRGQLMLALYRSGRQAEALDAYRDARETLADSLGIDPGPDLQRLEAAILRQAPALEAAARPLPESRPDSLEAPVSQDPDGHRGRGRSRRAIGALVLAGVILVVLLAVLLPAGLHGARSARAVRTRGNSVAVLDPSTASVVGDIPVGTGPGPIVGEGDSVWVGNLQDRTVSRIATQTLRVAKTFGFASSPVVMASGDGLVWVGNGYMGTLTRILAAYDQQSSPFYPGAAVPGRLALTTGPGVLWVGLADGGLLRLNPASLRPVGTTRLPQRAQAMTTADGNAWTIPVYGNDVTWVTPGRRPATTLVHLPSAPVAIASGDGGVWVATSGDGHLWQLNPATGAIVDSAPIGVVASGIAVTPGAVWVAGGADGVVEKVDPANDTLTRTIRLGHPAVGIVAAGGRIWVTLD